MTLSIFTSSPSSTLFFGLFIVLTLATLAIKCWLSWRQIRSVKQHRAHVPVDFTGHVTLSSHQRAADYTVAQQRFGMLESAWSTLLLLGWTVFGGLNLLNHIVQPLTGSGLWYGIVLILAFFLINGILGLPWSLWSTFRLEHRFGFNNMTAGLWVRDLILSTVIGLILGVPILALILWLMGAAGSLWWLWAWLAFAAWQLLLMVLFPVVIAPLFNKFKPLEDGTLLQRATNLMQRCGFQAKGFFVMDGSKRSAHSNAYFTGMGKSKRVVFYDTLLTKLTPDQMEAVLAHELGHFHYKHITKRIVMIMVLSLLAFAVLGWLSQQVWFYTALGVQMNTQAPNSALALLLFMLAGPVFTFFIAPIAAQFSRKDEFQADAYACQQANGEDLRSALLRLYEDNASTLTPDRLFARFYYSHPPAVERLAHLNAQT
ncbi:Protease HtpX [Saezia sanguinis]|uniref:Protease HtpX n=1 Tax=Saezia sanguinis TaxID=1965230 RepID=A0A433SDF9_9BURK|nr:M48 family metallopeptidase [Saezia sanguinis]RUS66781.1 Protease HtpX [Saezia sanguinis]